MQRQRDSLARLRSRFPWLPSALGLIASGMFLVAALTDNRPLTSLRLVLVVLNILVPAVAAVLIFVLRKDAPSSRDDL